MAEVILAIKSVACQWVQRTHHSHQPLASPRFVTNLAPWISHCRENHRNILSGRNDPLDWSEVATIIGFSPKFLAIWTAVLLYSHRPFPTAIWFFDNQPEPVQTVRPLALGWMLHIWVTAAGLVDVCFLKLDWRFSSWWGTWPGSYH